ncbi:MAG: GGDEF domain-containing protein [Campylobacterota bacterium]|nr:GGDEF domain-containing protein [Campylobacterota bacterium]
MLLPQTKEREYRFRLALRIGLPIFALVLALVLETLISTQETLSLSFYFESILLLAFSIYFIFYIIYSGFNVKITDDVTKTFTREYLYSYLKKEIKDKKEYTLILISIDNLHDINSLYSIKNGDRTLFEVAKWIGKYLKKEKINNFPLGHIKGGDFILGLEGKKEKYTTTLELLCLRSNELNIDNIEVKISGAITDTNYSSGLNYMVENLFELQEKNKKNKFQYSEEDIDPNELESYIINAINEKSMMVSTQDIYEDKDVLYKEYFVKLKIANEKLLYPKRYMKVINKLGLSVAFDLMVLEHAIVNSTLNSSDIYAINISPTSIRNENFLSHAKELLKENNIVRRHIVFILSEQEYYSHISRYNSILNSLRALGVFIAIDRLGSIQTSFLYLRELDIDIVRFDPYYSKEIKDEKNHSIIGGFNSMAQEKGIKTWIKNIEDKESYEIAKKMNIDFIQGKYLADLKAVTQ